jgi:stringent starvation protein B
MEEMQARQIVEDLLAKGDTMLCVDSRHPEVRVPDAHRGKSDLRLVLNLGFRNAIHVLPDGIQADLMFGGLLHSCWIPYEALWGVYNPQTLEGTVWPDRMPVGLVNPEGRGNESKDRSGPPRKVPPAGKACARETGTRPTDDRHRKRPALRVIPGGKDKAPSS